MAVEVGGGAGDPRVGSRVQKSLTCSCSCNPLKRSYVIEIFVATCKEMSDGNVCKLKRERDGGWRTRHGEEIKNE